ncbi:MAG: hypothetical protein ABIJ18_02540 [archaeon]
MSKAYRRNFEVREVAEPTHIGNVAILYEGLTFSGRQPMHCTSAEELVDKLAEKKDLRMLFGLCASEDAKFVPIREYVEEGFSHLVENPRIVSFLVGYKWEDDFGINKGIGKRVRSKIGVLPYYQIGRTIPNFQHRGYMRVMSLDMEIYAAAHSYTHLCVAEILDLSTAKLLGSLGFTDVDPKRDSVKKKTDELLADLERTDMGIVNKRTRLAKRLV